MTTYYPATHETNQVVAKSLGNNGQEPYSGEPDGTGKPQREAVHGMDADILLLLLSRIGIAAVEHSGGNLITGSA